MRTARLVSFRDMCPEISSSRYSTHAFHSYPAQLIPHIPYYFLKTISKNRNSLVFDPFCGTGTVLVETMHNGWDSMGVEINPVAALIAKVKTTPIFKKDLEIELEKIAEFYNDKSTNCDRPDFHNIHYWFDDEEISKLAKIKCSIDRIDNPDVKDFYEVVFSSIVKSVSKADPRIYVPVLPNDGYTKQKFDAWNLFRKKSLHNIDKMQEFVKLTMNKNSACKISNENILNFRKSQNKVDLVITSPPYISAQKYVRSTRLQAYWLGYDKERQLRVNKSTIGTESVLKNFHSKLQKTGVKELDNFIQKIYLKNSKRAGIVTKYFIQMKKVIEKIHSFLIRSGTFVMIIGHNTVMGQEMNTNKILTEMCEEIGFKVADIMVDRIISRGLMTKRNTTANIIKYEWVVVMKKE